MVKFVIRLNGEDPCLVCTLDFTAIFKLNFLKPTLFSFVYDYYASARMVASQLNHQIILFAEAWSAL